MSVLMTGVYGKYDETETTLNSANLIKRNRLCQGVLCVDLVLLFGQEGCWQKTYLTAGLTGKCHHLFRAWRHALQH